MSNGKAKQLDENKQRQLDGLNAKLKGITEKLARLKAEKPKEPGEVAAVKDAIDRSERHIDDLKEEIKILEKSNAT